MRKITLRTAVAVIVAVAVSVTGSITAFAWGPDRLTYTMENPADHNTFNSITNNPDFGDERNFLMVYDADISSTRPADPVDELKVEDGHEYVIRMLVTNNAADNLGLVAEGVRASIDFTTAQSTVARVSGSITSTNTSPLRVYDQAYFVCDKLFTLEYVDGSARYYNNVKNYTNGGFELNANELLSEDGTLLGYETMDGKIPGQMKASGVLQCKVAAHVENYDFAVNQSIRVEKGDKNSDDSWSDKIIAQPDDTIRIKSTITNVGNEDLTELGIICRLPDYVKYEKGTAKVVYSSLPAKSDKLSDNIIGNRVMLGGTLKPNENATVYFDAKIDGTAPVDVRETKSGIYVDLPFATTKQDSTTILWRNHGIGVQGADKTDIKLIDNTHNVDENTEVYWKYDIKEDTNIINLSISYDEMLAPVLGTVQLVNVKNPDDVLAILNAVPSPDGKNEFTVNYTADKSLNGVALRCGFIIKNDEYYTDGVEKQYKIVAREGDVEYRPTWLRIDGNNKTLAEYELAESIKANGIAWLSFALAILAAVISVLAIIAPEKGWFKKKQGTSPSSPSDTTE